MSALPLKHTHFWKAFFHYRKCFVEDMEADVSELPLLPVADQTG
jgi:hypothetical protein